MTVAIGYGIYTEYKTSSALRFWFTQRGKIRKEKNNSIWFLFRYSQGKTGVLVISDQLHLNSDTITTPATNFDIIWDIAHMSGHLD